MAKRVVQECDLTKQEYDPSETVTLVIKRAGKKAGRTYELSGEAASKLEQQLVAGVKLDTNWGFSSGQGSSRPTGSAPRTLGDLEDETGFEPEVENDEAFIAEKMSQRKAVAQTTEESAETETTAVSEGGCYHMNKGPIQTTMRAGKRQIYRVCRECRERIPEKRKDDKSKFMNAKAPADSRQGYRGEE